MGNHGHRNDLMATNDGTKGQAASTGIGRRTAIKGLAGAAAASIVWAEPTIKGLARRPAYARVGSGPSSTNPTSFELVNPPVSTDTEVVLTTSITSNGTPIDFFLFDAVDFGEPAGTFFLTAGPGPGTVGCECGIDGPSGAAELDYVDDFSDETVTIAGVYDLAFGPWRFTLPAGATPTRIEWTNLVVSCA